MVQPNTTNTNFNNGLEASRFLNIPRSDTPDINGLLQGALNYFPTEDKIKYWNGIEWKEVSASLTFKNGLREDNGIVKLGLDLTDSSRTIGILTEDLELSRDFGVSSNNKLVINEEAISIETRTEDNKFHSVYIHNNGMFIGMSGNNLDKGISIHPSGIILSDSISNVGMQYQSNYFTLPITTLDDRRIPDLGIVKGLISEIDLTNYVTLTDEQTITGYKNFTSGIFIGDPVAGSLYAELDATFLKIRSVNGNTSTLYSNQYLSFTKDINSQQIISDFIGATTNSILKMPVNKSGTIALVTDIPDISSKANISGQIFTGNISAPNLTGTNTGDQDLSPYQLISNLQTNLTASAVKYPSVDAVNSGLVLKQDLIGYTPENITNKVGTLVSPTSNTYIHTLGLSNILADKVNTSTSITGGYGITVGGDLSSSVSVTLNTSTIDNRYLRKDINDNNSTFALTVGSLTSGNAMLNGTVTIPSLSVGTSDDILVVNGAGLVQKKTLVIAGDFGVANAAGVNQFDVSLGTDLRFEGANDTTVTFDPVTKKVTISSIPGTGGGGAVLSFNTRTGAVVPVSGDYTTAMIPEMTNLYFTNPRVLATALTGLTPNNAIITATDTILQGFNKTQGQLNAKVDTATTLTINGTAGRLIISGGTQSLAANRSWTADLATIGTAGVYKSVTTDAYGRVIAGTNPTTLGGFGITDAYSKSESDGKYTPLIRTITAGSGLTGGGDLSANRSLAVNFGTAIGTVAQGNDSRINNGQTAFGWGNHAGLYPTYNGAGATGTWGINITGSAPWSGITGKPTTLGGYGITDVYTKAQTDVGFVKIGESGGGYAPASVGSDFNTITTNQVFYSAVGGGSNAPFNGFNGMVQSYGRTALYSNQLALSTAGNIHWRAQQNGTWGTWKEAADKDWSTSQFAPITGGNYVLKSGDTMTGPLTSTTFIASAGSALLPTYRFTSDATKGMWNAAVDALGFATAGVNRFTIGNSNSIFNTDLSLTKSLPMFSLNGADGIGSIGKVSFQIGGTERAYINAIRHTAVGQLTDLQFGTMGSTQMTLHNNGYLNLNWQATPLARFSTYSGGNTTVPAAQVVGENFGLSVATQASSGTYYAFAVGSGTTNVGGGGKVIFRIGAEGKTDVNGRLVVNSTDNSSYAGIIENLGTTNAHGLYVNVGATSTGTPINVAKNGISMFNVANSGASTFTGTVTAPTFIGALTGNATTASKFQVARTINGLVYDGTGDVTLPTVNTSGNQTVNGVKTFTGNITVGTGVLSTVITPGLVKVANTSSNDFIDLNNNSISYAKGSLYNRILFDSPTVNNTVNVPNKSGTMALTSDIPAPITLTTNGYGNATLTGGVLNIPPPNPSAVVVTGNYSMPFGQNLFYLGTSTTDIITLPPLSQSFDREITIINDGPGNLTIAAQGGGVQIKNKGTLSTTLILTSKSTIKFLAAGSIWYVTNLY